MCGIVGYTGSNKDKIEEASKIISHRGPDSHGVFSDNQISIGHRRLSIIDLSEIAGQPMVNSNNDIIIVFNGEIYNFENLKKDLKNKNYTFKTNGDTEVILYGYQEYGVDFFSKMRGMWAIAIYDKRNNKVILTRDYFGIKPMYYVIQNNKLFFSSEIKSLVYLIDKVSINTEYYYQYFNFGYFIAPQTCYQEIKKIIPGEIIEWDFKKKELKKYEKHIFLFNSDDNKLSFDDSVDSLDQVLQDSMRMHFVSDVPVGLLLSGGNDSSLLAALAKKIGKNPITFNLNISNSIDSVYAKKVSKHLGLEFHSIEMTEDMLIEQYNKIWDFVDEPTADISVIPTSLIFELIKGKAKVVLSGEGGDELFGGYLRHQNLARLSDMNRNNFFIDLCNYFSKGTSALHLKKINPLINRVRNLFLDNFFNDIIGSYMKETKIIDYPLFYNKTRNFLYEYYKKETTDQNFSPNLFFDRKMYLPNNLMYKCDISSMASSIESRVPFLDGEIINFINSKIDPSFCLSKEYTP